MVIQLLETSPVTAPPVPQWASQLLPYRSWASYAASSFQAEDQAPPSPICLSAAAGSRRHHGEKEAGGSSCLGFSRETDMSCQVRGQTGVGQAGTAPETKSFDKGREYPCLSEPSLGGPPGVCPALQAGQERVR